MNRKNSFIAVLALGSMAFASCSNKDSAKKEAEAAVAAPKIEHVRSMPLAEEEITRSVIYTATMEPYNVVHMAPTSPGRIEKINVEMGDRITRGQELVRMNDVQLIQAEIQLHNLEVDYNRLDTLKKLGSVAQQQYDQLKAQYEVAQENVEFLRKNVILKAPFNGIVSGKYFEAGEMYSGAPVAAVGKAAIISVIQIEKLKAIVSVSEKYFPIIKNGMEVKLNFDVYPDEKFTGRVTRISPTIETQSRSFEIEIAVNNPQERLRPGMFGRVTIGMANENALVLPASAILKMQGSNSRYLFKAENGVAKRVDVTMGERFDDKVEVISNDLKPGDHIIIEGQARLLDGVKIEEVN